MKTQGTIIYDPVHRVSQKKEVAVKRTHLVEALGLLVRTLPTGIYKPHIANRIIVDYMKEPAKYLATSRKRISNEEVLYFYNYLLEIANHSIHHPIFDELRTFLENIEARLCRTKTHPWTAIVQVSRQVIEPFYKKLESNNITITPSAWGPHITWVRREKPSAEGEILWNFHHGTKVLIDINETLHCGSGYWWVNISCPDLATYRKELGLDPKTKIPLHLTIGKEVKCAGHSRSSTLLRTQKASSQDDM